SGSASVASLPAGSPVKVLAPSDGNRLLVFSQSTQNVGWVDAAVVDPSSAPSVDVQTVSASPVPSGDFTPFWVMTDKPTTAWDSDQPDAGARGQIPQWRYLQVIQQADSNRLLAIDPRTSERQYVDAGAVGPVGPPPDEYFDPPPPDDEAMNLPARITGSTEIFERPENQPYFALDEVEHNTPINVEGMVDEGDQGVWYRVGDQKYVPQSHVRLPTPPDRTWDGRWIDANLTEPAMVTAYEGSTPVYAALAVKGSTAFQTPPGVYRILRRVQDETMDSSTIGIPRSSPNGYYLKGVLFTQYFTNDGAALHYNYWRSNWGYGASHGCLGMNYDDSKFFWDFG